MSDKHLHLYVSPFGHDTWSGMREIPLIDGRDGPLATLAAARDAARRLRAGRAVTVHVAAGVYELADTLRFGPDDGGTAEAPVRYVAALPANDPVGKRQVFIVPRAGRDGADALTLDPASAQVVAAPTLRVSARPIAEGCELAAVIPWGLLGSEPPPAEYPFELTVNAFDLTMARIIQQPAFDPLAEGSRKIWGVLALLKASE